MRICSLEKTIPTHLKLELMKYIMNTEFWPIKERLRSRRNSFNTVSILAQIYFFSMDLLEEDERNRTKLKRYFTGDFTVHFGDDYRTAADIGDLLATYRFR